MHLVLLQLAQNTFTVSICSFQAEPAALLPLNLSDIWLESTSGGSGGGETLGMSPGRNPQLPASPVLLWLSRDALPAPSGNPTAKLLLISSCSAYLFFSAPLCAQPAGPIMQEASQTFTILVSSWRFPGSASATFPLRRRWAGASHRRPAPPCCPCNPVETSSRGWQCKFSLTKARLVHLST